MIRYVYIVYEAQYEGEPKLLSVHKSRTTAYNVCAKLNKKCNPKHLTGFDNFYVTREEFKR
jgi:hypothetical protein